MRWVKPSSAIVSPSLTFAATASARDMWCSLRARMCAHHIESGFVREDTPARREGARETQSVQSLERGLAVLQVFSRENPAATLDLPDVVYVARVPTRRIMSITLGVGTRLPAHATSMGRVLLAALPAEELDEFLATTSLAALTENTV